jgi:toxin ParE1/3/4
VTRRFVVRPQADLEIAEAAEWYFERARGLAAEFVRVVDAAFATIERNPLQFPLVDPPIRRAVLRRFPYSILYCRRRRDRCAFMLLLASGSETLANRSLTGIGHGTRRLTSHCRVRRYAPSALRETRSRRSALACAAPLR